MGNSLQRVGITFISSIDKYPIFKIQAFIECLACIKLSAVLGVYVAGGWCCCQGGEGKGGATVQVHGSQILTCFLLV